MTRLQDLKRFYQLLNRLEKNIGGARILAECDGRMDWPTRGVYFFFEPGEIRADSGTGFRVVRVGTHALTETSRTSLWNRLSQHRGTQKTGAGNHRGSIFRLTVGAAIKSRDQLAEPTSWGIGRDKGTAARKLGLEPKTIKTAEYSLEQTVSQYIGSMPFIWLNVDDPPDGKGLRAIIEQNSIALLSNYSSSPLDPPSSNWLGHDSDRERMRQSGLWNSNHVDEAYDPGFLEALERMINQAR